MAAIEPATIPTPLQCRIARARLDGANESFIVERLSVEADAISEAWETCRSALTASLAPKRFETGDLLSDNELTALPIECLRCLLDWEEAASRVATITGTTPDGTHTINDPEEG